MGIDLQDSGLLGVASCVIFKQPKWRHYSPLKWHIVTSKKASIFSDTTLITSYLNKKTLFETFVLFGILDDGQNSEMWQHHVISWHPVHLESVSGVLMNTIYSLRRLNCVTGGCLCIKTAYCVFDESTGWYFLEDTNSHHISLYLEVKLCLLPFNHPRVCIVNYSTWPVIPFSPLSFL